MSCSWWRIPIHSGPLPGSNCPLFTFQPPSSLSHPFSLHYDTMTTSTTMVFLSGTTIHSSSYISTHIWLMCPAMAYVTICFNIESCSPALAVFPPVCAPSFPCPSPCASLSPCYSTAGQPGASPAIPYASIYNTYVT
jgi:hypothetical protein